MSRPSVAILIAGLACMGGVAPVFGQDTPQAAPPTSPPAASAPGADDRRFSFHRRQEGFVRLDSRTGEVAECGWSAAGWSCKAAPEERKALESEIGRLQAENAAMKKALLSRGLELPGGVKADPPAVKAPEAELDRAIAFVKDIWRRLVEMMSDLQRDIQRKS
jgi:hypothetical protein